MLVREHPGLTVHVSGIGAPHLVDPARLEKSARRLYGEHFDELWGELAPVPEENIRVVGDRVLGLDCFPSPGHARHHVCFLDGDGTLYAGDAAGVRIQPSEFVFPPAPPPEFDRDGWLAHARRDRAPRARAAGAHPLRRRRATSTRHLADLRRRIEEWSAEVEGGADQDTFVAEREAEIAALPPDQRASYAQALPLWQSYAGHQALGRQAARTRRVSRLGALREPQFRLLFLGRTASLLGSAFAPVALAFAVLDDLDGSATALGVVLAGIWLPQIVFILVGGVWADRIPRNLVMAGTDLVMFAAQGTIAVLLLTDHAELWQLFVLQLVRGTANAFFFPASSGLVPSVVSAGRLQEANALLRLAHSTTVDRRRRARRAWSWPASAPAGRSPSTRRRSSSARRSCRGSGCPRRRATRRRASSTSCARAGASSARARGSGRSSSSSCSSTRSAWARTSCSGPSCRRTTWAARRPGASSSPASSAGMVVGGLLVPAACGRTGSCSSASLAILAIGARSTSCWRSRRRSSVIVAGRAARRHRRRRSSASCGTRPCSSRSRRTGSRACTRTTRSARYVCIPIGLSVAGPLSDVLGVGGALVFAGLVTVVATGLVLLVHDVRTLRRTDDAQPELHHEPLLAPEPT